MNDIPTHSILLVDDDPAMRDVMAMLLNEEGYAVSTAINGLDALNQLRLATPALILSDLNMPQMSGFELLVLVRCRFPSIPVIAMSGAYDVDGSFPQRVVADAFYAKGSCRQQELLCMVAKLIYTPVTRTTNQHQQPAPPEMACNESDAEGKSCILLTCGNCMRSFPVRIMQMRSQGTKQAPCPFCKVGVGYCSDDSLTVASQTVLAVIV
jgi:CheY-like chemotaxis protein